MGHAVVDRGYAMVAELEREYLSARRAGEHPDSYNARILTAIIALYKEIEVAVGPSRVPRFQAVEPQDSLMRDGVNTRYETMRKNLLAKLEWADRVLESPQPVAPPPQDERGSEAVTREELNVRLRDYLEREVPRLGGKLPTVRTAMEAIGCKGTGTFCKLPAWKAVKERVDAKAAKPRAVSLTAKMQEAMGGHDEELQRLIAEQKADAKRHRVGGRERV